jgi:hypothetical protein
MYSENVLNVLTINITIVSILATLAIGVVTLLLSRSNIKLYDYFRLVAKRDGSFWLISIIFLNTILSLFFVYQPHTILLDIWLKIGIIPPIIFFIILLKNFEVVEKEDKMTDHLLFLLENNEKDEFIDFALNITNNSFRENFYSILGTVMKETKSTDKHYLFTINEEIMNKKNDDEIDYILEIQSIIVPPPNDPLFVEIQDKYLEIVFSKYKKLLFENNITYNNFILRSKSHLYMHIMYNKALGNEQEKTLLNKYLSFMYRTYELVIIILAKNNINDTREVINDFLGLVQFFSVNNIVNRNDDININKKYDYYLVGIICWILDYIIIRNLGIEHLDIIKTLLKRIQLIDLSVPDVDMFEEIITDINFHQIRYTRTFFIALAFLLCDEIDVPENLEKVLYDESHYTNQYLLRQIKDTYKEINMQEKDALNISREEYDLKTRKIIEMIDRKIAEIIIHQNKIVANSKIKEEVLENEKENIEKELNIFVKNDHKNFIEKCLQLNTRMPRRYLIGDSSVKLFGSNVYKTSMLLFFYKNYISNCENAKINKISDIAGENTKLIIPNHFNDYFWQNMEYSYKGDCIEIDNKSYPIIWIQTGGPIITLDNLLEFIHIPKNAIEISVGKDEEEDREVYTECEINIKYYINKTNRNIGYSLL